MRDRAAALRALKRMARLIPGAGHVYLAIMQNLGKMAGWVFMRPTFVVVGAQRSGTTSLYQYLRRHPNILPAKKKEIHYFDYRYNRGLLWYLQNFPLRRPISRPDLRSRGLITGEATPSYIFHPLAPARLQRDFPNMRLILVLRNPIDRAFSHFKQAVRLQWIPPETSFEEALALERRETGDRFDDLYPDGEPIQPFPSHISFVARGLYFQQILHLRRWFPPDQLFIEASERFFADPAEVLFRIHDFLGIPRFKLKRHHAFAGASDPSPMSDQTRRQLNRFFLPHNEALYEHLGVDFGWDRR